MDEHLPPFSLRCTLKENGMKAVFVQQPRLLERVGNVFTVRVDTDMTGTVLHQVSHPGEQPVFRLLGSRIKVPDLRAFYMPERVLWNANGIRGTIRVVDLPEPLRIIDAVIGDAKNGKSSAFRADSMLPYISRALQVEVSHTQVNAPGIMGFAMGADGQLSSREVAISSRMAVRLLRVISTLHWDWVEWLVSHTPEPTATSLQMVAAALASSREVSKEELGEAILAFDGVSVMAVRYPNASSTSYEEKTLRMYKRSPADCIFIPLEDLEIRHQGDCDGDRIGLHLTRNFRKVPNPLVWGRTYRTGKGIDLDSLALSEEKSPLQLMENFSERGRWVGLLTYNFWLLVYSLAPHASSMGLSAGELCQRCLDLFTPLIEGVMNARKGTGSGQVGGESLAQAVCDLFAGRRGLDVLNLLPVKEDGEVDEEKFSKEQIRWLYQALSLIAVNGKVNVSNATCTDPVKVAFSARFRKIATKFLIGRIPESADFYTRVINSLLCMEAAPWNGPKTQLRGLFTEEGMEGE
jgi:hypothetical protein